MEPDAHCDKHDDHTRSCRDCRMRRLVQLDRTGEHLARPGLWGPDDGVCRCPVFFPDYCPVHGG